MLTPNDIANIFGTSPRSGGYFWFPRQENEAEQIKTVLLSTESNKIILIDGPTGSGKTSLVFNTFYKEKIPHNLIIIDEDMDWHEFCRQIVSIPKSDTKKSKIKLGFSVKKFLPGGALDTEHETTFDPLKDIEYSEKYLNKISITDLANIIINDNVSLLIDDFEKVNDDLFKKIVSLSKKLSTLRHNTPKSKLFITSCHSSYQKMIEKDKTLSKRILHITLGGLQNKGLSWKFLSDGFDALNIFHPGTSKLHGENEQVPNCQDFIYDATGGNLKSLIELGFEIAEKNMRTQSIKGKALIKVAKHKAQENIDYYTRNYRDISTLISSNIYVQKVIHYIYDNGITSSHKIADIEYKIDFHNDDAAMSGISSLISINFLIPTGKEGSKVFVSDPEFALAFCVANYRNEFYRIPQSLKSKDETESQLPLVDKW